jgi:hypothetical protein
MIKNIINFLTKSYPKDNKSPKCEFTHYKNSGEKHFGNMKSIIRFDDHRNSKQKSLNYGVCECTGCGKRAFNQAFLHTMCDSDAEKVDEFINYKITIDEFIVFLKNRKFRFEIENHIADASKKVL